MLSSCVFDGEVYDATKELPGWDRLGFKDAGWRNANVVESPDGVLLSHLIPPIKVVEHLKPVAVNNPKPSVCVFGLGQNFAGWVRLTATCERGTRITLRYVDYLGTQATNHVLPQYWIGDWGTLVESWKEGEPVSVVTAFY